MADSMLELAELARAAKVQAEVVDELLRELALE